MNRYEHHFRLPEIGYKGQLALKNAKVLIVGMGGLGGPAGMYLAAAGVGTISIVDDDRVDLSNLQRQVLYSEANIGVEKVFVAAQKMKQLNSNIEVTAINKRLTVENFKEILMGYDLVLDCSDNFTTKYLLNDICYFYQRKLIYSSIQGFAGMLGCFTPKSGCFRCVFPYPPKSNIKNCSEFGVMGALPGVMGAWQALEAIKHITGNSEKGSHFIKFDFMKMRQSSFQIKKDVNCPLCGEPSEITAIDQMNYQSGIPHCKWIDFEQASKISQAVWLDIRGTNEFLSGHLPGALNVPHDQFSSYELSDNNTIIYCKTGRRCQLVWDFLKHRDNVYYLKGGYKAVCTSRTPS